MDLIDVNGRDIRLFQIRKLTHVNHSTDVIDERKMVISNPIMSVYSSFSWITSFIPSWIQT